MINTISLSNDQKQLYLIDAKRVITFDLEAKEGVTIGLLGGQLSAISSLGFEKKQGDDKKLEKPITVELKINNQFTLAYNRSSKVLTLIGSIDIVQTRIEAKTGSDPTATCSLHLISLEDQIVHLRKKGDFLIVTPLER